MGRSEAAIEYASSDCILDILLSFTSDVIQDRFLLVGESYGGYLARGILSRQINDVDGLMLLCTVIEPIKCKRQLPKSSERFFDEAFLSNMPEEDKAGFIGYAVIADENTYRRYKIQLNQG